MARTVFSLIVLLFLVFSCSNNPKNTPSEVKNPLPVKFTEDKEKFIEAINCFRESNKISSELGGSVTEDGNVQMQKMKNLIIRGIQLSKEISDEFLDYLHPDLKENFKNKLVKSNELYYNGLFIQENMLNSFQNQVKANQLVMEWSEFWKNNNDQINRKISVN
jgi:hypothetical protein